ncbi:MAG: L-threonylcarbamoyladenylate synthase [Bauldia sp.]
MNAARILPASDPTAIPAAVEALRAGALVAMPTETVYGLAADAANPRAVAGIFAAKGRPRFNPLIVHVANLDAARAIAILSPEAERLAVAFWPGPLTLVLPKRDDSPIAELATAGLPTIAIRIPSHPVARALLVAFGGPLAAPSANRSGHVSATAAAHVAADLGSDVALILDAGPATVGIESTIVGLAGRPTLLRAGGVDRAQIEAALGATLAAPTPGAIDAPGMLASHYAPAATLRLNATSIRPGETLLAFGQPLPGAIATVNLSATRDLKEAAANLFAALRTLDGLAPVIAVAPIPNHGLGEAINDRLARAAAPRS